jgi:hypothetical protein
MGNWNESPPGMTGAPLKLNPAQPYPLAMTVGNPGSWYEVAASIPRDMTSLVLEHGHHAATNDLAFDIAIGASGSEVIVASDFCMRSETAYTVTGIRIEMPLSLPKGERLCIRAHASTSYAVRAMIVPRYGQCFATGNLQHCETYGSGAGVNVIRVYSATGSKGSWTELAASTTRQHFALGVSICGLASTAPSTNYFMADVGVGAAGSEVVILKDLPFEQHATTDMCLPSSYGAMPVQVPKGERLSIRLQAHYSTHSYLAFNIQAYS